MLSILLFCSVWVTFVWKRAPNEHSICFLLTHTSFSTIFQQLAEIVNCPFSFHLTGLKYYMYGVANARDENQHYFILVLMMSMERIAFEYLCTLQAV